MAGKLRTALLKRHPKHPIRRAIWGALARIGATGMHALPVSKRWVDFHRRAMPLRGLSPDLEGLKLVQISDLHYSPVVWRRYIEQYVEFVNELRPDVVVVTGDLITGGYRYAGRVAKMLKRIEAPLGVVCTFGNHDYSMWGKQPRQAKKRGDYLEQAIEADGVIVLRNEVLRVTRAGSQQFRGTGAESLRANHPNPVNGQTPAGDGALLIVGLDDEWTGMIDPEVAFAGVRADEAVVCLNHNPVNARELLGYPWQWMLAGHTHGRQIGHKGLSKALVPKRLRTYVHGYYEVDGRHLYVNRGLSYGQRVHHWCRPEVTVFKLTAIQEPATSPR